MASAQKPRRYKRWSEEEKKYLLGLSFTPGWAKRAARYLRRTEGGIRAKAIELLGSVDPQQVDFVVTLKYVLAQVFGIKTKMPVKQRWEERRNFPVEVSYEKDGTVHCRMVRIDAFWDWAESHKQLIPWNLFEEGAMGVEPGWATKHRRNLKATPAIVRGKRGVAWTKDSEQMLKDLVATFHYTTRELSLILGHSESAVTTKCRKLGLKARPVSSGKKDHWRWEDSLLLLDLMKKGLPYQQMARVINRNAGTIRRRILRVCPEYLTPGYRIGDVQVLFGLNEALKNARTAVRFQPDIKKIRTGCLCSGETSVQVFQAFIELLGSRVDFDTRYQKGFEIACFVRAHYLGFLADQELRKIKISDGRFSLEFKETELELCFYPEQQKVYGSREEISWKTK